MLNDCGLIALDGNGVTYQLSRSHFKWFVLNKDCSVYQSVELHARDTGYKNTLNGQKHILTLTSCRSTSQNNYTMINNHP